jgi:endoglucanase
MPSITIRPWQWLVTFATVAVVAFPTAGTAQPTPVATPESGLLVDGVEFFVDPDSSARRQAEEWRDSRPDDADAVMKIANHAQADWFGDWTADPRSEIGDRVSQVTGAGALPVLVVYNIPYRDCGLYSAGGANDPAVYRTWIEQAAEGIGNRPAVVVLEPDALAATDCLTPDQTAERYELIAFAVDTLGANPATDVYIDAGNVSWHPADETARRLALAGIDRAAGFALNVSNFHTTGESVEYGLAVSDAIAAEGGTHFVIDTSRNGNGAWDSDDPEAWCNPPGRALGEPPTVDTADPLVDAYLWVKRPGESDGECRGAPAAGQWYPEYALELARNARWE